jgi:hypothetical protein
MKTGKAIYFSALKEKETAFFLQIKVTINGLLPLKFKAKLACILQFNKVIYDKLNPCRNKLFNKR